MKFFWFKNQFSNLKKRILINPYNSILIKILENVFIPSLLAILAVLPRLDLSYYNGKYLWAEDGNVYINQAKSQFLKSLIEPYNGYLQTYPRIIALLGNLFQLKEIPNIYLGCWMLTLIITIFVISNSFKSLGHNYWRISLAIAAILLQPNCGEIFFNSVNTQWFIGLSLAVYLIAPGRPSQSPIGVCGTFIASISGPFAIIYSPIILYKIFIEDKFKKYWLVYFATLLGALIQAFCLFGSPRVSFSLVTNYFYVVKIFFGVFSFGARSYWLVGVVIFWMAFCYLFIKSKRKEKTIASLFVFAGVLLWLASIYSFKSDLPSLASVVFGTGDRYTFIPYATFILAYIVLCRTFTIGYLIFSICLLPFFFSQVIPLSKSLGIINTEFNSYADFAQYDDHVIIPINPIWATFPGWHIKGSFFFSNNKRSDPKHVTLDNTIILFQNNNFQILLPSRWCSKSEFIGIESVLYNERAGWIEAEAKNITGKNRSLKRFYPSGYIIAQFAFPNEKYSNISINFKDKQIRKSKIRSVSIYCPGLRIVIENKFT